MGCGSRIIAMDVIDLTQVFKEYKGRWVALGRDEKTVLASGKNASEVYSRAQKKLKKPILFRVPSKLLPYIGFAN